MIIQLEMMDTFSKSIKTDYNEIILRYLIIYIMIKYYETYPGIGIDNDSLADILVTCYPDDFTYFNAEQSNTRQIKTVGVCSTIYYIIQYFRIICQILHLENYKLEYKL